MDVIRAEVGRGAWEPPPPRHRVAFGDHGGILLPVLARAEALLEARGEASLPPGITPHSLRHTFASLLFVMDEDPVSVMRQLGHTDAAFTLRVYAHAMSREPEERERLRALAEGREVIRAAGLESERHRHESSLGGEWVAVQLGADVAR